MTTISRSATRAAICNPRRGAPVSGRLVLLLMDGGGLPGAVLGPQLLRARATTLKLTGRTFRCQEGREGAIPFRGFTTRSPPTSNDHKHTPTFSVFACNTSLSETTFSAIVISVLTVENSVT